MVDLGKGTKLADDNDLIAKRFREDIVRINKRIEYANKYIPYMELILDGMKRQKELQEKIWVIQQKFPKKLTPEYEFEEKEEYHKLMQDRSKLSVEKTRLDTDFAIYNKDREIKEYKSSLEQDKAMLKLKEEELKKIEGE